jgi:hypothetical protein
MDPDRDPEGPKTCGSSGSGFGFATLGKHIGRNRNNFATREGNE